MGRCCREVWKQEQETFVSYGGAVRRTAVQTKYFMILLLALNRCSIMIEKKKEKEKRKKKNGEKKENWKGKGKRMEGEEKIKKRKYYLICFHIFLK